jgi:3-oxoadipyl-CoA thiolase
MIDAFICDAIRTPIGRYAGSLASVRADDLAAIPLRALLRRNAGLDPRAIEDGFHGMCKSVGRGQSQRRKNEPAAGRTT